MSKLPTRTHGFKPFARQVAAKGVKSPLGASDRKLPTESTASKGGRTGGAGCLYPFPGAGAADPWMTEP